jgi:hypothetical protein
MVEASNKGKPLKMEPLLNAIRSITLLLLLCIAGATFIGSVAAQSVDEDPVFFVVGDGSIYSGGVGWYAGYVISGDSGTYTLQISANGPEGRFPVTDVKVVVCVSDEATQTATVTIAPNTAKPMTIKSYTVGKPSYFPPGGVFSEPDYYGYNDAYSIAELTYSQTHHPTNHYDLQVSVTFAAGATENSKVMFLCYGIDSKGDPAKTPFSGGTLIVALPEFAVAPVAVLVCFAAFAAYRKQKTR